MTLVSKNGLSFIDLVAVKSEIGRKGPLHLTELLERPLSRSVPGYLEISFSRHGDFDFVSLFEIESFDDCSRQTDGQAVTPFRDLHDRYTLLIVYPSGPQCTTVVEPPTRLFAARICNLIIPKSASGDSHPPSTCPSCFMKTQMSISRDLNRHSIRSYETQRNWRREF